MHELASATGISADYLGWLLRHGKLVGEKRAGRWYARLAVVECYQRDVAEGREIGDTTTLTDQNVLNIINAQVH